ncbi:MAG: hypothetical protein L3J45_09575 [Flavobacteriaceae bacterium]|nr:hypothetical protein [Flavobacteriaceae bacterium]
MKKLSFKIASFLLAFTVLFSTLSFSVNKHYCGDMLFVKSYFFHTEDCGMENMDIDNTNSPFSESMRNNNCYNVKLLFHCQNEAQKALLSPDIEINNLALVINFKSFDFESDFQKKPSFYQNYSPPLLVKNIPVLVQNFRI